MTAPDLLAIRAKALAEAERLASFHHPFFKKRIATLRHIALDCDYALEGCPASLEAVEEFIVDEPELSIATASEASVPVVAL